MTQLTQRLYFTESHRKTFSAQVKERTIVDGKHAVVLDRTAFYPTGGGQPHDTGSLGGVPVVGVIDDGGMIVHLLDGEPPEISAEVEGTIDWPRRFDHMQQHTGQHILSQALIAVANAETRGFRMDGESATIDVALDNPGPGILGEALALANEIVFENRAVRVHLATDEDLSRFPLRKEPGVEGEIRVIEVAGFDWTPCGGTHVQRTGEVGAIVIRHVERAKKMTRIEFLCGKRAVLDYATANESASAVARLLTVGRDEILDQTFRLTGENKQLKRRVRELEEAAAEGEARRLFESALELRGVRLVRSRVDAGDPAILKLLVSKILACGPALAALWTEHEQRAHLVIGSSALTGIDASALMKEVCAALGGKGGGTREVAQGGCQSEGLAALLEQLFASSSGLSERSD